ncbi:MAG: alpha/beta hydrolase [Lachnospiraceae bacterium]|nr:alpha/beta hydrolase [Lachnospiraceae bacterium]
MEVQSNNKGYKVTSYIALAVCGLIFCVTIGVAFFCGIKFSKPIIEDMTFRTPKSSTNGSDYDFAARLFTPRDGKKTHPVIIVSHGYNSTMENCEDVAEYYANKGIAVIVFDFVGGSRNSSTEVHSSEMTAMTEMTDYEIVLDYVKNNDAFDKDNFFISGQSFGGLIATAVAERHQDEIRGVILYYPAYYMADYASEVLAKGPTKKMTDDDDEDQKSDVNVSTENGDLYDWDNLLVSETYLKELSAMDMRGIIRNLNKDVMVLQGDLDEDVTLESTQSFMPYFPSAKLVIITDGEHGFFDEQLLQAEQESTKFMNERLR